MKRRTRTVWIAACAAFALVALAAVSVAMTQDGGEPEYRVVVPNVTRHGDAATATTTATATGTPSVTPTTTATSTVPPTETATPTPTGTVTATATATNSATPSATATASPTATATTSPTTLPTPSETPQSLETIALSVTDGATTKDITVQVADSARERQTGLMFVTDMPEDEGMLFVFQRESSGGFWMRNTYIPLDIVYLDADGTVMEIRHGEPLNQTSLTPAAPYWFTLEMNGGWFERNGFEVGDTVVIPDELLPS